MRKAPCYKGGGRIKGEPDKPKQTTIDRNKYKDQLSKPIEGTGTNVVGDSQETFNPDVLKNMGYNYVSGTMGGRDIVYEKNGNYHLYNEQPNAAQNKYGLINIGNPNAVSPIVNKPVLSSLSNVNTPIVDTTRKPLDFSNPNITLDPNTGSYKNPVTGAVINPIIENYKNGGKVKGYDVGGDVEPSIVPQKTLTTQSLGPQINTVGGGTNNYQSAINAANNTNINNQNKKNGDKKISSNQKITALNLAGQGLNAVGDPQDTTLRYGSNDYFDKRNSSLAQGQGVANTVGAIPIVGAFKSIGEGAQNAIAPKDAYGVSDRSDLAIAAGGFLNPLESTTSAIDDIKNKKFTKRTAANLLAPGLGAVMNNKENKKQRGLLGEDFQNKLTEQELNRQNEINRQKAASNFITAMVNRDEGITSGFANGGLVKGKGTGKSDSIDAKVVPGSFVVPVESVPIVEEIKEKVLRKAPKKANLNQKGGTQIRVSNGEMLLDPEEKKEIEMYGYDVDALAPDSDDNNGYAGGGGVKTKAERDKIKAEEEALKRAKNDESNKERALDINKRTLYNQDVASKKLIKADKDLKSLEKEYEDFNKRSSSARSVTKNKAELEKYDEQIRIEKKALLDKIDQANKFREDANKEYRQVTGKDYPVTSTSSSDKGGLDYLNGNKRSKQTESVSADNANTLNTNAPYTGRKAPVKVRNNVNTVLADRLESIPLSSSPIPYTPAEESLYGDRTPAEIARMNQTPVYNADVATNNVTPAGNIVAPPNAPPTENVNSKSNKYDYSNILGNAINYGIPLAQTAIGLRQLKKAGDRPVDQLDPDYVDSLNQTRKGVTLANDQALYGFTGAEKTALDQQNTNLTNAGRYAARNFSGGSSANALNMERSVINDSFGRALNTKVNDNQLKLAKQQEAFNRQQVLNNQIQDKQDRLRQYFGDTMIGWQQNQQAGSQLVGAGLQNLIGASRYNQEKAAAEGRAKLSNSWITGI